MAAPGLSPPNDLAAYLKRLGERVRNVRSRRAMSRKVLASVWRLSCPIPGKARPRERPSAGTPRMPAGKNSSTAISRASPISEAPNRTRASRSVNVVPAVVATTLEVVGAQADSGDAADSRSRVNGPTLRRRPVYQ